MTGPSIPGHNITYTGGRNAVDENQAICSCGWKGTPSHLGHKVEAEAKAHLEAEARFALLAAEDEHPATTDIRIPRDKAKRDQLAQFAGLTDEERHAIDVWCDQMAAEDDAKHRRGAESAAELEHPATPDVVDPRCGGTLGDRPSWMSPDQYSPCRCRLDAGHGGPHWCEHLDEPDPRIAGVRGRSRLRGWGDRVIVLPPVDRPAAPVDEHPPT